MVKGVAVEMPVCMPVSGNEEGGKIQNHGCIQGAEVPCKHGAQAVFLRNMADDGVEADLKAEAAAKGKALFLRHAVREIGLKV